jgi:hypothetical protein
MVPGAEITRLVFNPSRSAHPLESASQLLKIEEHDSA